MMKIKIFLVYFCCFNALLFSQTIFNFNNANFESTSDDGTAEPNTVGVTGSSSAFLGGTSWFNANATCDILPRTSLNAASKLACEGHDYLGAQSMEAVRQQLPQALVSGKTYSFSLCLVGGTYSGSPGNGTLQISFGTTNTYSSRTLECSQTSTSNWTQYTFSFTANANYTYIFLTCAGTSTLDGNSIGIDNMSALLPIQLSELNTTLNKGIVDINWQTLSEDNNDYFTIEKSSDGIEWEELSKIDGAGNSSEPISYRAIDIDPNKGLSYYRVKQTDFNGVFTYSEIKSIYNTEDISVLPNPTSGIFGIGGLKKRGEKQIQITDVYGNLIHEAVTEEESIQFDFNFKPAGVYYIYINDSQPIKIIKQ